MVLGDLTSVLESDQTLYETIQESFQQSYSNIKEKSKISKILSKLSHYGMYYDDAVLKNMVALPADKALQPKDDTLLQRCFRSRPVWHGHML